MQIRGRAIRRWCVQVGCRMGAMFALVAVMTVSCSAMPQRSESSKGNQAQEIPDEGQLGGSNPTRSVGKSDVGGKVVQSGSAKQPQAVDARQQVEAGLASDDEQKVLAFIGEHQPELAELLKFLADKQPAQYRQAMREMKRAVLRLDNLRNRDQKLFKAELQLWQTRSKLRLLAAEISVAASPKQRRVAETKLKALVEKEIRQDRVRMKLQRERLAKQLERLDAQIERREQNFEALVERALKQWQNRIERQSKSAAGRKQSRSEN